MAFVGIVTNGGLAATQLASLNQGWYIIPSGFGVSSTAGALDPTRTTPNGGNWYGTIAQPGPISGRVVENFNTVKFICTIPPGEALSVTNVNEIYLYVEGYAFLNYDGVTYTALNAGTIGNSIHLVFDGSSTNAEIVANWNTANPSNQVGISSGPTTNVSPAQSLFLSGGGSSILFAIGEANPTIQYDPTGQLTLELSVGVLNSNLTSQIVFDYTQATEVADHNLDPLAHPDIQAALEIAGIFPTAGQAPFIYDGQTYDQLAVFDGTPSSGVYQGVTYTAVRNGSLGNSITLVFDGILTINSVVSTWNLNHPNNSVKDNASNGNGVPTAGSITLSGGTLSVNNGDVVYANNGVYYQAIANGTAAQNVAGIADLTYNKVNSIGFIARTTGYPVGTALYLSATTPGAITDTITSVLIGTQIYSSPDVILFISHGSGQALTEYSAVVTSVAGLNNYPTTQQAINAVASGASILVEILEDISTEILTHNKKLNFFFLGPQTGWTKSVGTYEVQLISFSAIPTSGTWRIYWSTFVGPDLAFDANAAAVQAVFEGFGLAGVSVTGNYSSGFTITYPVVGPEPLPFFTNPGQNEIQTITFSSVPTDGCFQIEFLGDPSDTTAFFCYNNTLSQLQAYTDTVLGVGNSIWSGSFSSGFTIQYQGSFALQPITLLQILNNGLVNGITPVNPTVTETQGGLRPAANLLNSLNQHITITPSEIHLGTVNGPATAIQLTENDCNFLGNGLIYGFTHGFDFNGTTGHHIEMTFDPSVTYPILSPGLVSPADFSVAGSVGAVNSDVPGLRVLQHPTISTRLIITPVDQSDFQGGVLAQVLNNQLLVFPGAQVDFGSGNIYAADGVTVTGSFSPVSIPTHYYAWYALALQPGTINADNTISGTIQIQSGIANASLSAAPKPAFQEGTIPLAQVYNQQGVSTLNPVLQSNVYEVSMGAPTINTLTNYQAPYFQQEVPSGVVDGVNTVFGISQTPKTALSLLVFLDELPIPCPQWNLVGTVLTLSNPPAIGQSLSVYYVTNSPNPIYGNQEIPVGVINGINPTFTLSGQPSSQSSIIVFVDGLKVDIQNWSLVQSSSFYSIQFNSGYIPVTGQDVYVYYLINLLTPGPLPISSIQSVGAGVPLYAGQIGSIASIKSLIRGSNIILTDDGMGGVTISSTGGGGGGGAGAWTSENLASSPLSITALGGFTPSATDTRQVWFLTATGVVTVIASPGISPGGFDGQELILKGTSMTNYPIFTPAVGLDLNGPCSITLNQALWLIWNQAGSFWFEVSRRF